MKFVSAIWKLLVGIKDALVLLLMLLFFGILYVTLTARPDPVREGVLEVALQGSVTEQPAQLAWTDVAGGSRLRQHRLRDLVAALDAAKDDRRVKAVALDLDGFLGGGQTAMSDISEAVQRVRRSGKPVVAYATGYTDDSYQVASAASEIWLNPLGAVLLTGPGSSNLYFKGLLDKLGVTANVYRVGTYKAAVEPYIRNDMSPEAKQNALALDQTVLETWRQSVKQARPKADANLFLRDSNGAVQRAGGDMARAALNARLVDRLGDRSAFQARLQQLGGEDAATPAGFKRIKLASYIRDRVETHPAGPIGIVTIAGMIVDGEASGGTAGGDTIAESVEEAVREKSVKALVVRVDSPGGSVLASERIRQALAGARSSGIPVVVSMGNVAASGGYWIATPANFIFAEPSTITGSIGVFGVLPSFQGALEKLGIGADGVKTTPLSGEPDLLRGPSPAANQLIQTGVEAMYVRFLNLVAASRGKTPQQVNEIAQGRVWDGGTAHQLGLVDGFGGMEEAVAKAAQLARLGDERDIRYLDPARGYRDELLEMFTSDDSSNAPQARDPFASLRRAPQQQLAAAMAEVRAMLAGPSIQARCLECPPVAPVRMPRSDASLLDLLRALIL
jgi:protease-4